MTKIIKVIKTEKYPFHLKNKSKTAPKMNNNSECFKRGMSGKATWCQWVCVGL